MPQDVDVESSHDVPLDITNPWASASASNVSFSSAIKCSDSRPAMRRRMSDGATRERRSDRESYHGIHSRALTLDSDVARPTSSHPLASPSSARSVKNFVSNLLSAHDTRPRMKRVLSDAESASAGAHGLPGADQDHSHMANTKLQTREEQRLVIMHDVMADDSLAGVALKYGVTLPDLRRWNQLWPSDPIHLRKVLYIPFDKARHAKQFRVIFADAYESAVEPEPAPPQPGGAVITEGGQAPLEDTRDPVTVVRVPVTQLSFFPPPSSSSSSARRSTGLAESQSFSRYTHEPSGRSALSPSFSSSSTSLPNPPSSQSKPHISPGLSFGDRIQNRSLGALWTSARTTIVERLSLDSGSATTSSQSEDMDWAHELEDVSSLAERPEEDTIHGLPERHMPSRRRRTSGKFSSRPPTLELDPLPGATPRFEGIFPKPGDRVAPPRIVDSQPKVTLHDDPNPIRTSPVRTAQLQPSPVMQLPHIRKKPKPSGG